MPLFLLDTHALIWMHIAAEKISDPVKEKLRRRDATTFFSAASVMEVETKFRIGKLPEVRGNLLNFEELMNAAGLVPLPISVEHARRAGSLPIPHKDPFDRFLIAQSLCDGLTLISNETVFDSFGIRRLW